MLATVTALSVASVLACDIKVRDSAFRVPRDIHRLCVIAMSGDESAESIRQELAMWLDGPGNSLNLELLRLNVDDPSVQWEDYDIPSTPSEDMVPVVALVGRDRGNGQSIFIDHWQPSPSAEDLKVLESSPTREAIQQELGHRLAVLLYAPGSGLDDGSAQEVLDQAVEKWSKIQPLGISVVRMDRLDERERTLLQFIGLEPEGPDWVGVVFGRGKLMTPPLKGSEISVDRLDELIGQLTAACSCSKPLPTMGIDVPMAWHDQLDAEVVLMDDPEDNTDDTVLENVLSSVSGGQDVREATIGSSLLATTMWSFGAITFAVFAISIAMFWRKGR